MKKYCVSAQCIEAERKRVKTMYDKDKVKKVVGDNVLECPDCGDELRVFKMRRGRGKITRDIDNF